MTRDEAENIGPCISTVQGAGEILVADTGSSDGTIDIAAEQGARVIELIWDGFGKTRAEAFENASREWIFWLDADERVTPELWDSIGREIAGPANSVQSGYEVHRRSNFLGRWMRGGGWGRDLVLRLFRQGEFKVDERDVHERVSVSGGVGQLKGELLHYTDPSLSHYLHKFNSYSTTAAEEMHRAGNISRLGDMLLRPLWTFFRMYVVKRGLIDGLPGFVLAGLSGTYVFVKYVKLWEMNRGLHEPNE